MSRALLFCGDPGIPLAAPSGAASHLRGTARALAALEHEVRIATPWRSDHRGEVSCDDLTGHHHPAPLRRWPRWLRRRGECWQARALLREAVSHGGAPDWIWERHALFIDAGLRWAADHKVPRLVEFNAPLTLERARYSGARPTGWGARLEARSLVNADRVVAVSSWLAQYAVDLGCKADRVRFVPNGTDLQPSTARDPTRDQLGCDGLLLGFVGGLRPWHGGVLLKALLEAMPEARMLVIGSGSTRIDHPRAIHRPWLPRDVLAAHIAAMDVSLAPMAPNAAPWFGPLKLADYRSQGTPIVASRYGDLSERIGAYGEVVATTEIPDWVAAVRRQAGRRYTPIARSWLTVTREALDGLSV